MKKLAVFFTSLLLLLLPVIPAKAVTIQSAVSTINLSATVNSSLTVTVDTSSITFTNGNASAPVTVTTAWNLATGQVGQVVSLAYFNTAVALTGTGSNTIPTSAIQFTSSNGTSACNVNQTVGTITFPNACSADIGSMNITTNLQSQMTNTFTLAIPTLPTMPPDIYAGTISVAAVAF